MTTSTQETQPILNDLLEKAKRAHNWTSFDPDKRGTQIINDYSEELTKDLQYLKDNNISEESINDYESRYRKLFSSWINAKSNCTSAMITGPANYNMKRHDKTQRSEQRNYELFREWRERAKKAIVRKSQPIKTFISELERYRQELESMKKNHELMKEGNRRIKQALKDKVNIDNYLIETFSIQPHMLEWTMKFGFGLQNNLANIKRVEDRIKTLEKKEELKNSVLSNEQMFNGFSVIQNFEIDRLQIKHDNKPNAETITLLKSNGFKWSPRQGVWQRQLTQNAIYSLKHYLLPKLI